MKENLALRLAHDSSSKEVFADSSASLQACQGDESLPQGVSLRSLQTRHDERGSLMLRDGSGYHESSARRETPDQCSL
jgi:hypothetical protein